MRFDKRGKIRTSVLIYTMARGHGIIIVNRRPKKVKGENKGGFKVDPESVRSRGVAIVQVDLETREKLRELAGERPMNRYLRKLINEELARQRC